ncbi:MAG: hypothetical protein ABI790_10185 [Betaproteobacteria bacterium]
MRDATVFGGIVAISLFALPPANAQDPVLRDVDVRSFLGEPLNLRIALAASTETVSSAICQSVIDGDRRENALRASDLILTMVELRNTRYLQVRSRTAFSEPVARFSLRIGCPGEPIVDREFTVLLDPPPFTALPVSPLSATSVAPAEGKAATAGPAKTGAPTVRLQPVVPASGTWTVYAGDTITKLAKGIHPRNRARQRQYIAVLRDLNPALAKVGEGEPLTPGSQLALPDLLTLSGIMPRVAVVAPPARSPASTAAPAAAKKAPAKASVTEKTSPRTAPKSPTTPAAASPAPIKAATAPAEPTAAPPAASKSTPAVVAPAKPAPAAKTAARSEGFQLRLSNADIDLSRSRNVTEEQRRVLREKLLMLDADDQLSALLSLRNTVKQLEQRINDMQLKLATAPATASLAPAPVQKVAPSPVPAVVPAVPAATSPKVPVVAPPAALAAPPPATSTPPSPAIAAAPSTAPPPPAAPAPKPVTTPPPADRPAPAQPAPVETAASDTSLLVGGGVVVGLLLLMAAWMWSRRGKERARDSVMPAAVADGEAVETPAALPRRKRQANARDSGFSDWAEQQVEDTSAAEQTAREAFTRTTRTVANDVAEFENVDVTSGSAAVETMTPAHHQIDAPVIFDDTPAQFEVDSRPATTVDFLVGMDEKLPEDRVRRLQYMHERYPELKTNTVSIDDADSVINAARFYYEEADKGNGRDKASELLTFAVEERPQEIRYWLAQFEIFRLENMVAEFTAMAGKFHVLFSHTPAWPKVRHIGHELDPGSPLFAAGGSPLLAGETRFDPIAENWLNAPMDFTSEALMSDLRLALLDDNGVSRADFESITARLSASAGAA